MFSKATFQQCNERPDCYIIRLYSTYTEKMTFISATVTDPNRNVLSLSDEHDSEEEEVTRNVIFKTITLYSQPPSIDIADLKEIVSKTCKSEEEVLKSFKEVIENQKIELEKFVKKQALYAFLEFMSTFGSVFTEEDVIYHIRKEIVEKVLES